jgi:hypothetical protein
MKLSEAIREGAKLRPQAFHAFFIDGRSCALAAAIEVAAGRSLDEEGEDITTLEVNRVIDEHFPLLWSEKNSHCPACERDPGILRSTVEHLNDTHRWTREQIADWVEKVEAA